MLVKSQAIFASLLIVGIIWSTSSLVRAQNEELRRPTRPDVFNSPEEVAQYVKDLHEYVRAKGIRYGKRLAPLSNEHTNAASNELGKHHLESDETDAIDEENPQEQLVHQQMRPQKAGHLYRQLAQIPLPLLVKYLRMNPIIDPYTPNDRTMAQPFMRPRYTAAKQKINDF